MSAKVNLVLDDEVKADLAELVPPGERSRFANDALRTRLDLLKRQHAVARLATLRRNGPPVLTSEIVRALRQARDEP